MLHPAVVPYLRHESVDAVPLRSRRVNVIHSRKMFMENSPLRLFALVFPAILAVPVTSVLGQQGSAEPGKQAPFVFSPANTVIYVSDFGLDSENFQADQSMQRAHQRPHVVNGPLRQSKDPATQARELVNLMATDIVQNLTKAGYKAQRLAATDARPSEGVWVHGVFTELNEGNRRQRAVIGFGAGQAKMDLYVTMNDLSRPDQPLYTAATSGESGKKPGAAITMNPYLAAAKFVMEKNAPEKTIKKTAGDISKDIIAHLREHEVPLRPSSRDSGESQPRSQANELGCSSTVHFPSVDGESRLIIQAHTGTVASGAHKTDRETSKQRALSEGSRQWIEA